MCSHGDENSRQRSLSRCREARSQSESPLSESTFLLNFVLESCNRDSLVIPC